ncbi:MAG: hypothetical protein K8W52_43415 [Deltaproteobacteria bacterium]|nr:hypothetical protein [Deltaproteobacteria bacterium]
MTPATGARALPRWAKFMSEPEWAGFLDAVEAELRRRNFRYRIDEGYVWAPWGGDDDEALSLLNLAQLCHAAGPEQYPPVISGHFDALVAGRKDRVLADELGADLDLARPHLKLRLYPRETFHDQDRQFILRDVADDLCAVACFDLPSNVVTVNADSLDRWRCTADDVWYQALANLRRTEKIAVEDVDVGGAILRAMTGDSFFVASNLLLIDDFIAEPTPWGALAAVPNRHTLVFHPISDPSALRAIDAMVVMASSMCADGPGSISPNLFWCRGGEIRTLPTRETEDHFEFVPPDEFVDEVLEQLAERVKMN